MASRSRLVCGLIFRQRIRGSGVVFAIDVYVATGVRPMNLLFAVLPFTLLASDKVCTKHLDRLLAIHQEYGLPLPPPQAKLVQFMVYSGQVGYSAERATKYVHPGALCLGFSIDGRTVLGNFNEPWGVDSIKPAKPDQTALEKNNEQADLLLAVQCHARGWTTLSRAVYRNYLTENRELLDPEWNWGEDNLVTIAWDHWLFTLSHGRSTPLPLVAKYLKRLLPYLSPEEIELLDNRELIRALERSLVPRNSRPGSNEALIDNLIHVMGFESGERKNNEPRSNPHYDDALRAEPKYQAMLRRGFVGVPALIDHLNDERLTRVVRHTPVFNQLWETYQCRVKNIAWDLLCDLADEQLAGREVDAFARVAAARKWFARAEKIDEEEYIVSRVLGRSENVWFLNNTMFWLLCDKYPKRLPEVYRKLIDLADTNLAWSSWRVAKAVSEGPFPVADKREILEYAARQSEPFHCAAGVKFLRPIDPKQAHESLIAGLVKLSGRITDGGMVLAEVAADRDDPREWQSLAKAVRCADVGSRLELLKLIAEEPSSANQTLRLKFIAEYLTDDGVRNRNDDHERYKFEDHIAGGNFDRLEVRNFAAYQLAELLELNVVVQMDWTPTQWGKFRDQVRVAAAVVIFVSRFGIRVL